MDGKRCSSCGLLKHSDEYHNDKRRRDGKYPYCIPCRRERSGAKPMQPAKYASKREYDIDYRAAQSAAVKTAGARRRYLWTQYTMTPEEYDEMLRKQNGRCAICGETESRTSSKFGNGAHFHVDHDHACCNGPKSCGKCIRGLLCSDCNTGLGLFRDSTERLRAAGEYLEAHHGSQIGRQVEPRLEGVVPEIDAGA